MFSTKRLIFRVSRVFYIAYHIPCKKGNFTNSPMVFKSIFPFLALCWLGLPVLRGKVVVEVDISALPRSKGKSISKRQVIESCYGLAPVAV
jgi:hypothetical protein